jgi:hypothetical protein
MQTRRLFHKRVPTSIVFEAAKKGIVTPHFLVALSTVYAT